MPLKTLLFPEEQEITDWNIKPKTDQLQIIFVFLHQIQKSTHLS